MTDRTQYEIDRSAQQAKLIADARKLARIVKTVHPTFRQLLRRRRLERSFIGWCKYYFPAVFYLELGEVHHRAGATFQKCIEQGGRYALSMSRGNGKSAIGMCGCLYGPLSGRCSFPAALGASNEMVKDYKEFVLNALMNNERLKEDYPEICCFIEATEGKAIRATFQLLEDGTESGLKLMDKMIRFPSPLRPNGKPYPGSGAYIAFRSADAKIRGIKVPAKDGRIVRPEMVILDDIQDEEIAASDRLSEKMEKKIISAIMNIAGPDVYLSCYMPCTIQRNGDVASRFLNRKLHPDFQGENVPMFVEWPKELEGLWVQYHDLWKFEQEEGRGLDACHELLKANWDKMHEGAKLTWENRIRYKNGKPVEISALQTAMHLFFENGDAFYAEYQGEPLDLANSQYKLSVDDILEHVTELKKYELPAQSEIFVGHTDINRAGLHWCLGGFTRNMTCHVPVYGKYPDRGELWQENASQQEKERAIFGGLQKLCDNIERMPFIMDGEKTKPSLLLIDRGYEHGIVDQFCAQAKYSFRVVPNFGQSADKFRPSKAKAIGAIMDNVYYGKFVTGRAVAHNADFWRETTQRSFLTDSGNAGGTTIYKAKSLKQHVKFAEHVTGERLVNKFDDKYGLHYVWQKQTKNQDVDWLDALVGTWAAAGYSGLSPSGLVKAETKQRTRVAIGRPSRR